MDELKTPQPVRLDESDIVTAPFVPLRGIVVFPKLVSHVDIGRPGSLAAVDYAMEHDRILIVSTQMDENEDDPEFDDIYQVGVLVKIQQLLRLPGGLIRILVNGLSRVQIQSYGKAGDYVTATAVKVGDIAGDEVREEAFRRLVLDRFAKWLENLRNGEEIPALLPISSHPRCRCAS